jgi:hypothetical protein
MIVGTKPPTLVGRPCHYSYLTRSNTCACGSVHASKKPDQSYPSDVHVCLSVLVAKCFEPLSLLSYSTKHSFVNTDEAPVRWQFGTSHN